MRPIKRSAEDKGGCAEHFRAVVHAFETLIDAQKRQVYNRIQRKEKQKSKMEGNAKTKVSKARPRPDERPEEDVKESEMGRESLDDQRRRLQKLLILPRKRLVAELKELSEQQLRDFKSFLESEKADELIAAQGPMLALKDERDQGGMGRRRSLVKQTKTWKGVRMRLKTNGLHHQYWSSIGLKNFHIVSRIVRSLDLAVDFHISLVQIKQEVLAGLAEGGRFQDLVRASCNALEENRSTAGEQPVGLRFKSAQQRGYTPTQTDLEKALADWSVLWQKHLEESQRQREERAKKSAERSDRKLVERANRIAHQHADAVAKYKAMRRQRLARLRKLVAVRMGHFERLRKAEEQGLLKGFGVCELPKGLQLSSFQGPNDTICAMLPLDGTLQPGPFRRSVAEALKDLKELRRLKGEALRQEMQRRDVEAMTAFFAQTLEQRSGKKPFHRSGEARSP